MTESALAGLVVLDLTHYVSGPYCTKLLAGHGAEVIKIERPGLGDGARHVGPFLEDRPGTERSLLFAPLNTGKKSVTLNLKTSTGRTLFLELVRQADMVVESFRPGVMARLGLPYEELSSANPALVMVSISNFGQSGPYRDFTATELTLYAWSSLAFITGEAGRPPLKTGALVSQYVGGQVGYVGALTALLGRTRAGGGRHVDVSIHEANVAAADVSLQGWHNARRLMTRTGNRHYWHPWGIYPCQDGYVGVTAGPPRNWPRMAELTGEPGLSDPRFATMPGRTANREEIDELLRPWLMEHTKAEIYRAGQAAGFAFAYVATAEDLLNSPQLRARGFFVDVDHPELGCLPYPGAPWKMSATPWQTVRSPLLGEHTSEVLEQRLGYCLADQVRLHELGVT